jgi:hypothetical protein
MIKKYKRYLFPASMIVLGSFLEIYYYAFRFTNDGIDLWLATVIGIALTLLLSLAVFMRNLKPVWFLIIPLSIYSVICTSAGQSFSLGLEIKQEKIEQVQAENNQKEIDDTRARITWIDNELAILRKQKDETITSLADRYKWKNTLRIAEAREKELTNERGIQANKLSELRAQATTSQDIKQRLTNIYEFYNQMTGWSPEWLQFSLHTILSIFIALMSPLGIIIITNMPGERPKRKRKSDYKKQDKDTMAKIEGLVEYWVHLNWMGIRSGKSQSILPSGAFYTFIKYRKDTFNEHNYETIFKAAVKLEILEADGTIKEKDERKAIQKIISLLLTKKQI